MGAETLLEEIIVENVPNLWKETDIQEAHSPKPDESKQVHAKIHYS